MAVDPGGEALELLLEEALLVHVVVHLVVLVHPVEPGGSPATIPSPPEE